MLLIVTVTLVRWGATTKSDQCTTPKPGDVLRARVICYAAMMHSDVIDAERKIATINVMVKDESPEASAPLKTYPARYK